MSLCTKDLFIYFFLQMLLNNVSVTNVTPGPVVTDVSKNSLTEDGSAFGITDDIIANGMSVKRYTILNYESN